jgi:hypothetical protein
MANILACQTLGEMSTPSRAEQSRMQQATWLTHCLGFHCIGREITRHKSTVIWQVRFSFSFDSYSDKICKYLLSRSNRSYRSILEWSHARSLPKVKLMRSRHSCYEGCTNLWYKRFRVQKKGVTSAIFKKYLQCVLAAKILTVYFVVCTLAVKRKSGQVGSDHSLVSLISWEK